MSVCVCLCVCPANILVFYFSAISRDIDLKFIQDTHEVVKSGVMWFYVVVKWFYVVKWFHVAKWFYVAK